MHIIAGLPGSKRCFLMCFIRLRSGAVKLSRSESACGENCGVVTVLPVLEVLPTSIAPSNVRLPATFVRYKFHCGRYKPRSLDSAVMLMQMRGKWTPRATD